MSDDLKARLRETWCGHSGMQDRHNVNPDGPEAADRIEALEAEVARLREVSDKALDALFDAVALIGRAMPMHTEALIGGERMIARDVWQKGHDIMFPSAALEPKP